MPPSATTPPSTPSTPSQSTKPSLSQTSTSSSDPPSDSWEGTSKSPTLKPEPQRSCSNPSPPSPSFRRFRNPNRSSTGSIGIKTGQKRHPSQSVASSPPASPGDEPERSTLTKRHSHGTSNMYGRHSNDWLFGGVSVTETVKKFFEKK